VAENGRTLAGQVAWVTGSSRGLGRVIATHLARLGATVAVHGTTPTSARAFNEADSLEQVARDIAEETESPTLPVYGDLTDDEAVRSIAAQIRDRFGQIDILVNNAGGDIGVAGTAGPNGGKPDPNDAVFIPLADVRAVLDRNLLSCIIVCREVAPEMIARRAGRIVNISSVASTAGRQDGAIYAVAKAGLNQYTRCLAAQLRPYNVPVNAIAPGSTITPRFLATGQANPQILEADNTLERYGQPLEVARAVEFFVAEGGTFVSGQILRVDGGSQLWPV
jgi:3-oxoacyl-[acyl-carrier protein] reductase